MNRQHFRISPASSTRGALEEKILQTDSSGRAAGDNIDDHIWQLNISCWSSDLLTMRMDVVHSFSLLGCASCPYQQACSATAGPRA